MCPHCRAGRAPEVHKFYIETSSAGVRHLSFNHEYLLIGVSPLPCQYRIFGQQRLSLKTSYYVRMRPHLEQFLAEMCTLFELYIYTAGSRSYAK